jgi:hypothetical protein
LWRLFLSLTWGWHSVSRRQCHDLMIRKHMTYENTYRDDKMYSTRNKNQTKLIDTRYVHLHLHWYTTGTRWQPPFVYLHKIQKGYIKLNYVVCLSDTDSSCHVTVMRSLIVLVNWLVLKFHGFGHLQIILHLNKITECLKMTTFKIVFPFNVFLSAEPQTTLYSDCILYSCYLRPIFILPRNVDIVNNCSHT